MALPDIFSIQRHALIMQVQNFQFQTHQAARVRAKCERILALLERAEARVYKATKALVEVRCWTSSKIPRKPDQT